MWANKRANQHSGKGELADKLIALHRDAQMICTQRRATSISETSQAIRHRRKLGASRIVQNEAVYEREDEVDYSYLRVVFVGERFDSEWYPDEEVVSQVLYLTDLDPEPKRSSSSWIFAALLMMPETISPDDRRQMLEVFEQLVRKTEFRQG